MRPLEYVAQGSYWKQILQSIDASEGSTWLKAFVYDRIGLFKSRKRADAADTGAVGKDAAALKV